MLRNIAGLMLVLLVSFNVSADTLALREDAPRTYVVQKGDTLWDISGRYLLVPWRWPEIWHLNPQVENPHLIYPGDLLSIIYVNGAQRVQVTNRGSTASVNVSQVQADGTVKWVPQIREQSLEDAIPAISRSAINSFLSQNRIVDEDMLKGAPYIVSGDEGRIIIGRGDTAYARGNWVNASSGYDIFRPSDRPLIDPITKEYLGFEAINLGSASVSNVKGEIATLYITRSSENIQIGTRLVEVDEEAVIASFVPSAPASNIDGVILKVHGGVNFVGQFDVVIINKGEREGLKPGNVMQIRKSGGKVVDPFTDDDLDLPDRKVGIMMVFKTFEKVSYGVVLEATSTIEVGNRVTNPN